MKIKQIFLIAFLGFESLLNSSDKNFDPDKISPIQNQSIEAPSTPRAKALPANPKYSPSKFMPINGPKTVSKKDFSDSDSDDEVPVTRKSRPRTAEQQKQELDFWVNSLEASMQTEIKKLEQDEVIARRILDSQKGVDYRARQDNKRILAKKLKDKQDEINTLSKKIQAVDHAQRQRQDKLRKLIQEEDRLEREHRNYDTTFASHTSTRPPSPAALLDF